MKTIYLKLMGIILIFSMSACDNNQEPEKFSLKDTYWAYESSVSGTIETWYHYSVWHFISETEAEEINYDTDTKQVDIQSGLDPQTYGISQPNNTFDTKIQITSLEYPAVNIEVTETVIKTGEINRIINHKGEFMYENKLLLLENIKTGHIKHFYKLNKMD